MAPRWAGRPKEKQRARPAPRGASQLEPGWAEPARVQAAVFRLRPAKARWAGQEEQRARPAPRGASQREPGSAEPRRVWAAACRLRPARVGVTAKAPRRVFHPLEARRGPASAPSSLRPAGLLEARRERLPLVWRGSAQARSEAAA